MYMSLFPEYDFGMSLDGYARGVGTMSKKPNVIFLISHDVGPVYGAYGNAQIHTPNIDEFAARSIQFNSHYCQWPLCGPSRANIFSGCRPLTISRFDNLPFFGPYRKHAPSDFAYLPEYFARSGFNSRGFGFIYHDEIDDLSWTEGHEKPTPRDEHIPEWAKGWIDDHVFLEWKSPESLELIRRRLQTLKDNGITREVFHDQAVRRTAQGPAVEAAEVSDDAYYDGKISKSACSFIKEYAGNKPYFLGVGFMSTHTPYRAPKKYWDYYRRGDLKMHPNSQWPQGSAEWMAGDSEPAQHYTTDGYTKPWRASEEQSLELLHGKYAVFSYVDAQIGKIIAAAKARGDWENTIVVVTSDHGFSDGQHGYWGKHNMWDPSLSVPLLIKPGNKELHDQNPITRITEQIDIYPTLCDLAGLPVPDFCEGSSLLPLVTNPNRDWKDTALSHRKHIWHDRLQVYDLSNSLRTPRYRYTEYLDPEGSLLGSELFDYETDPLESRNLADDTGYQQIRVSLSERLRSAVSSSGKSM
jgi:iduronate 2-sulfatase